WHGLLLYARGYGVMFGWCSGQQRSDSRDPLPKSARLSPLFCGLGLFSSKARQFLSLQWRIAVDINPVGRLCRHVTGEAIDSVVCRSSLGRIGCVEPGPAPTVAPQYVVRVTAFVIVPNPTPA